MPARLPGSASGFVMLAYATLLHAIWALIILWSPSALMSTPLFGLSASAEQFIGWTFGIWTWPAAWLLALMLMAAAASAIAGGWHAGNMLGLAMMIPQQFLLLITAWGCLEAVISGAYADGVPRPWPFILADQLPVILAAPLYTVAIVTCNVPARE